MYNDYAMDFNCGFLFIFVCLFYFYWGTSPVIFCGIEDKVIEAKFISQLTMSSVRSQVAPVCLPWEVQELVSSVSLFSIRSHMGSVRREEPCRSIYSRSLSSPSPRCKSHPLVSFRHGAGCTLQCSAVSSRTYSGSLSLQMSFSLAQYHQKSVNENKRECKAYGWEIYATLT